LGLWGLGEAWGLGRAAGLMPSAARPKIGQQPCPSPKPVGARVWPVIARALNLKGWSANPHRQDRGWLGLLADFWPRSSQPVLISHKTSAIITGVCTKLRL